MDNKSVVSPVYLASGRYRGKAWKFACAFSFVAAPAFSAVPSASEAKRACLLDKLDTASDRATLADIRALCGEKIESSSPDASAADGRHVSAARKRVLAQSSTQWSPHVLTAHRQNYILPYTYVDEQNPVYKTTNDEELADNREAKFQLSFKFPLNQNPLFVDGDALHFGFTLKSFWQVYNDEISAPFRETNYAPELFYTRPLNFRPRGADTAVRFGAEHESNGRTQLLSRSWNRIYTQFFYAKDNYLVAVKPWYRIPEDEKDSPEDAKGDDNPDIEKYMGYFELNGAIKYSNMEFTTLIRNNMRSDNYGAIELGVSFPLWGRLRGYAQYFNGHGESMVDYDHRVERIGIGFLLTDLM